MLAVAQAGQDTVAALPGDWRDVVASVRSVLDYNLFAVGDQDVTVATAIVFVLIILASFAASWMLQRAFRRALSIRGVLDPGTVGVTTRLLHYAVVAIGLGIGLSTLGLDLGALFAAGAIFAVALGFAMQNIAENFVSGVILLVERVIKPGDVLNVEGEVVRVVQMGIRSTVGRSRDEEELIIPNSKLVSSTVTNYTLRDSVFRVRSTVGVTYASDMKRTYDVLLATAERLEWRDRDHDPVVLLTDFGDSSVNFQVSVWIDDPWRAPTRLSELNQAVWWALKDAGVVIAFPQLDVHLDRPVAEGLARIGANGAEAG